MGYSFKVKIKGQKQGQFKGESPKDKDKDTMLGLSFAYEVKSPRDVATGQPSGKRQHMPIRFVKEWGAATPQIFTALTTNEVLPTVSFEFTRTNANGEEYVYYSIKLTDASISDLRQFTSDNPAGGTKGGSSMELEEVSLTFRKIEVESKDGKTMATDDVMAR